MSGRDKERDERGTDPKGGENLQVQGFTSDAGGKFLLVTDR